MLRPLNDKTQGKRSQIAQSRAMIAPIKGWFVGSPMANAPLGTAFLLENAFPEYDYVRARAGAAQWATGLGGVVNALMPFNNGVVSFLFAYANGKIFDVTVGGAVGAPKVSGLTVDIDDVVFTQYSGTGPQTLLVTNGIDPIQYFNGTTWATGEPVQASGTITFHQNPANNDTITLGGTVVTFVTAAPVAMQVQIASDLQDTLVNLGIFLANSDNVQLKQCTYSVTPTVLTIDFIALGVTGNAFTIAASAATATASGATLTGGIASWTGLPGGVQIAFIWQYYNRLYGIATQSTDVYYLDVNAIAGPVTVFPMGPLLKHGGQLVAGGTWNQLTSNGVQYQWFVISSEGEVVLFRGSFPGDVTVNPWTQTGCYKIGRPLGVHCINTVGGDASILTENGLVALSQVVQLDEAALTNPSKSLTGLIAPAYKDAVQARVGQKGWSLTIWPMRYMAILNMPQSSPPNTQFVANERTGYWCRFTGWDARCFAISGLAFDTLYYGTSDGRVMQAETGGQDDGKSYTMTVFYSYSGLGSLDIGSISSGAIGELQSVSASQAVARKKITMVRARFQTNVQGFRPTIALNVDYDVTVPSAPGSIGTVSAGSAWDVARWGVDKWAGPQFSQNQGWVPVYAMASAIAPIIQVTFKSAATPDVRLTNVDVLFEPGNIFG